MKRDSAEPVSSALMRRLHGKERAAEIKAMVLKHCGSDVTLHGCGNEHAPVAGGFMRPFKDDLIRSTIFNFAFWGISRFPISRSTPFFVRSVSFT